MKAIRLFSSDCPFPLLFHLNHSIKEGRSKVIHLVPNHLYAVSLFYKAPHRLLLRLPLFPPTTGHTPTIGSPHTKAPTWRPVWPAQQDPRCEGIHRTAPGSEWRAESKGKRGVRQKTDTIPIQSMSSIVSQRSCALQSSQIPYCRYHTLCSLDGHRPARMFPRDISRFSWSRIE